MNKRVKKELQKLANPEKAKILSGFFKTGKGEYGEGDIFLGIAVPEQRRIAKRHSGMALNEIEELLSSKVHEHRLTSLLILIKKYKKSDDKKKRIIFDFYLRNVKNINNWDLVDISAPNIVGDYLLTKPELANILYRFAKSKNLWERRISILSVFAFIRANRFEDALKISELLLKDENDLVHKAVGWMLREIGKRNMNAEEKFLDKHYRVMPRTMLRYAIEKFEDRKKKFYLNG